MELRGIDVSHNNGVINWATVKSQIDFAILRCGYGDNITSQDDKQFMNNVVGCRNNNIPFGVYLYSYAKNTQQAKSEAEHVIRQCQGINVTYPIFLDMEEASQRKIGVSMLGDVAQTFIDVLNGAGYNNVGIYANKDWFTNILTDARFNNWLKWVARYNSTLGYNGSNVVGWQYSSEGTVSGISGNVDMNIFYQQFGSSTATSTASEYPYVGKCTGNGVRVREGAGRECKELRQLNKDNLVDVLGKSQSATDGLWWYWVNVTGLKGYVHPDFITRA